MVMHSSYPMLGSNQSAGVGLRAHSQKGKIKNLPFVLPYRKHLLVCHSVCDVGREEQQQQPPVASPCTAARRFEHGTLKTTRDSPDFPFCAHLSACSLMLYDDFCFPVRLCLRYPSPPSFLQLMGFLSRVYILNPRNLNHTLAGGAVCGNDFHDFRAHGQHLQ